MRWYKKLISGWYVILITTQYEHLDFFYLLTNNGEHLINLVQVYIFICMYSFNCHLQILRQDEYQFETSVEPSEHLMKHQCLGMFSSLCQRVMPFLHYTKHTQ